MIKKSIPINLFLLKYHEYLDVRNYFITVFCFFPHFLIDLKRNFKFKI